MFFARRNSNVFTIDLEGDAITINTSSLLAFDASLEEAHHVGRQRGHARRRPVQPDADGPGTVGITSDGPPMLLDCSLQPTFVDPQAAVCWSANLAPIVKNDFTIGSLIGRGSGESFQLAFHGPGFVVVQPSEGRPSTPGSR
ncbi:AIM24 family protein [Gordonia sp. ABSL11-1]|uniref:AIM24 family protein n=1 Tax=Gordonia sp. ABSL11-1 TaxID=3053924 RepID=UPI002574366B|nr:AIM24 family protein [Gordonia sp. ABSL11-1]MDL9944075.1 AIM24 family protein [Gordonia sp. ABSL11-1]